MHLCVPLAVCLAAAALAASAPPGAGVSQGQLSQLGFDAWTSENGLPQNSITCLLQDRKGYIWVGTLEGAARFDGQRFADRRDPALYDLPSGPVMALSEATDGRFWLGTMSRGLFGVGPGGRVWFDQSTRMPQERMYVILEDDRGLWIGTGRGMARVEGGDVRTVLQTAQGLPHPVVTSLAAAPDGSLWVGTGGGVERLVEGKVVNDGVPSELKDAPTRAMATDDSGTLWIGTSGRGLYRLSDAGLSHWGADEGLEDFIGCILPLGPATWVGTRRGLLRLGAAGIERFPASHPLAGVTVLALLHDREGSLWVGTQDAGLLRVRASRIQALTSREGLSDNMIMSVAEASDGSLLVATAGGGLNRVTGGRVSVISSAEGLPSARATCVLETRGGDIWIGTSGAGLVRQRGRDISRYTVAGGELTSDFVLALFEDSRGRVWVGTNTGGVSRFDGQAWRGWGMEQGLPAPAVSGFAEDPSGALWIATQRGLACLLREKLTAWTRREGLPESFLTTLHLDSRGSLWIGTLGGGVLRRSEGGRFDQITSAQGLPADTVWAILEDDSGNVWMSSNQGVMTVPRVSLDRAADGDANTPLGARLFGRGDGMPASECNGGNQPSAWKMRDGRMLFPTLKGVAIVDPQRLAASRTPVPVVVEAMRVDQHSTVLGDAVVVPPGSRNLEIDYTALTFLAPQRVAFRYRLEGMDEEWVEAGRRRTAYYTRLRPGHYRFRVIACNQDGQWGEEGGMIEFTVAPRLWETRWFQLLCAIALVAAAAGGYVLRIRRMKKRERELERIVDARTRDLHAANEELRRVHEQLAHLAEATPDKIENISGWGALMAAEIVRVIHARQIRIYRAEGERLVSISGDAARSPSWESLQHAGSGTRPADGSGERIIAVRGMSGELRGALVIEGALSWSELEHRLVTGFADHLGSALDLQHLREQLTVTEARQAAARERMQERGIRTVKVCPRCGRCEEDSVERCQADGSTLDASRLLPHRLAARYRLTRLLGEGGMGSVFAALDEKLAHDVAVKVIRAELLQNPEVRFRIEREARVLTRLHHPSVISLLDSGELDDGSAFLVMELVRGCDVAGILRAHGPASPRQVASLLRQAGAALGAAHRAGIVHRDVKPANILLIPDGDAFRVKVLDFGLAKAASMDTRLTQTGVCVGTPAYMSPEQAQGLEVNERSDLYSLAAVAYETLTGRGVVLSDGSGNVLLQVLNTPPPRTSAVREGLSKEIDDAFEAALAKNPADRPADVVTWAESIALLLDALPVRQGDSTGWPMSALENADRADRGLPSPTETRDSARRVAEAPTSALADRTPRSKP